MIIQRSRGGAVNRITPRKSEQTRPALRAATFASSCESKALNRNFLPAGSLKGELRQIQKNRDVVVAGRHYGAFYLNHDGWLFRYKILHNGDRQIVDFILPGQIFGLQACFFKASLYSIAAVTAASVSALPIEAIDDVFEKNPRLAKALFWSAVCEAAIVGEHLIDTARRSAYERVSHLLLE